MSAILALRDYQRQAIKAIHSRWDAGQTRIATVLATGSGKTVIFTHLAEEFLAVNPGRRVLVLAHTDELVLQAAAKMRQVAPHRKVGIVKASQNETSAEVVVASVQSLRSKTRRDQIRNVGLMIIDECHHAVARTYRTILEHFGAFGAREVTTREVPDERDIKPYRKSETLGPVLVAGFTATLVRSDREKLSDVWEDVAFRLSIAFMIRSGYLLDVRGKRVQVPDLDLRQVKQSGGDYQEGALGEAMIEAMAPQIVAKAYLEQANDRKGIGFAPTVDSAYAFAEAFAEEGIKTEVVHGALHRDERRAILGRFRDDTTQVVWNCMVLTEGFDEPSASCAIIARPTKSAGLYQQMVGRVLRPDLSLPPDERGHALILDVVGISAKHGDLRSLVDLSTREDIPEDLDTDDIGLLELEDMLFPEEEEEIAGGGRDPDAYYVGETETREFDPLGRDSKRTWGVTPDGTYYLKYAGALKPGPNSRREQGGYVFLSESIEGEPGTYDVVWCREKDGGPGTAGLTEHRGLNFEMALAWAEEEATERGGFGTRTLTTKTSRWRKDPASTAQVGMVRRAGHKVEELTELEGGTAATRYLLDGEPLTKGRASDLIDAHAAAQRIDPLVQFVKRAMAGAR